MLATVRKRRGMVTAVEPSDGGSDGTFHLASVEYIDAATAPPSAAPGMNFWRGWRCR
jgi:hypothetical protein